MTPFTFVASDNLSLAGYKWEPAFSAKAVVHIVHGLAEHTARYARTARSLNAQGYVVYASDLRGHGQSAPTQDDLGFWASKDGWARVLQDVKELLAAQQAAHPDLPLLLLGHSLGSYVAQQLTYECQSLLSGTVLSAPNGSPNFMAQMGSVLARIESWRLGKRGRSQFLNSLTFGKFNEPFAPVATPFDWLSRDAAEVQLYFNDAWCGFICSTQLWVDFLDGIVALANPEHKKRIRSDYPIYIFAGDRDPVCANGRGARKLAREYEAAGLTNVTCKIYAEGRHEMLNETNRQEVLQDLAQWLGAVV